MISRILFLLVMGFIALPQISFSQSYGGKYKIQSEYHRGQSYTLYMFSRKGGTMKAKYFAQNAYYQYQNWKSGKDILLVTAGAFSTTWDQNAPPVGLCVDNGSIVNRKIDYVMDGMVIIYNGGAQAGGVAVVDLDENPVRVEKRYGSGKFESYHPRDKTYDRINFLNWGEDQGVTLFQTQLVYSSDKNKNFSNLYHGDKRERRFLSLCRRKGELFHIVIDAPNELELNLSGKYTKEMLEKNGFDVLYILNLDTGGKNILQVDKGRGLTDLRPNPQVTLSDATNLIIYYKD